MRLVILSVLALLPFSLAEAATIYVPDNHPTIQGAINASVNGDMIIVRTGKYAENIDFSGKAIVVKSELGPTMTVIDGTQSGWVAAFTSGGIALLNSSPTVNNTIVWDNTASTGPEFFKNSASLPVVQYCDIKGFSVSGPGNINANPLFGDAASHDYSLRRRSPCINRGSNAGCPGQDIEGDARPWMGTCDMGADEFTDDHGLGADRFSLNASTGGTVYFFLFGGAPNGGRSFLMLGSLSGTAPGLLFPGGTRLPLNYDAFTLFVYQNVNTPTFQNFSGNPSLSVPAIAEIAASIEHFRSGRNSRDPRKRRESS